MKPRTFSLNKFGDKIIGMKNISHKQSKLKTINSGTYMILDLKSISS